MSTWRRWQGWGTTVPRRDSAGAASTTLATMRRDVFIDSVAMKSATRQKTLAFTRCIGVFEGGGVRGAGFAGAIAEAADAGVTFVGAVGSSAGSIAAALVGAGVPPAAILAALSTPMKSLLRPHQPPPALKSRFLLGLATRVLRRTTRDTVIAAATLGLHSSAGIEQWLNALIRGTLRDAHDPVQFSDLPLPVAVLAADVVQGAPKVWSRRKTPDASVAYAVRCSCSIPFFFQPVGGEASLLVDGGVIANLPLFLASEVASELGADPPTLCFRLVGDRPPTRSVPSSAQEFGHPRGIARRSRVQIGGPLPFLS
jgi:predicted acylesterase/phospholipase RssA